MRVNEEETFIKAIYEDFDNDIPRLIFADWLEERGDVDRAEFIRVQCELARDHNDAARHSDLREREKSLLEQHKEEWLKDLPGLPVDTVVLKRGLPWLFVFDDAELGETLSQSDAVYPQITCVDVRATWPPDVYREHKLELSNLFPELRELTLERLSLLGAELPDRFEPFPKLRELYLWEQHLGDEGAAFLAECGAFPQLRLLQLEMNAIYDAGAIALARSTTFPQLRELDLTSNRIGDLGAVALAESSAFPELRKLNLSSNWVGDEGACALARSRAFPTLEELRLGYNYIGEAGIAALTERGFRQNNVSQQDPDNW